MRPPIKGGERQVEGIYSSRTRFVVQIGKVPYLTLGTLELHNQVALGAKLKMASYSR